MPVPAGTRIGPYDVLAPIGAGGMGEVYRARDTRLGREVALKTLPASFAADADRLRRFEQEAKSTGLLNHPNILAVYDVGSHEAGPYVVSELLEGETLRERIGGTAMPARKAIDYGVQIARGLAAAHDKGIVHRDLKPENIFVTRDGRVKILDFGLAKLMVEDVAPGSEVHTFEHGVGTDAGQVMGTAGYMSPEQVRARPVDHRSDIFSFGAVLYEMLSGQRAFRGASSVETMNAILKEDPPPLTATNRQLPPALERIVGHCLEKNADERFQSARDIAFDLEALSGTSTQSAVTGSSPSPRRWLRALAAIALAAALVAVGIAIGRARPDKDVRFQSLTFQNGLAQDARFAPDGKQVLYQAQWPGMAPDVYVMTPGSPESRPLGLKATRLWGVSKSGDLLMRHGTNGELAQVPLGGGAPRDLMTNVDWASWGPDGAEIAILHNVDGRERLEYPIGKVLHDAVFMRFLRVSPSGSHVAFTEHPLTGDYRGDVAVVDREGHARTLSAGWNDLRGLAWSPDGREVWFSGTNSGSDSSLWAVTLDGRLRSLLRAPGSLAIEDAGADGRVLLAVQRRRPSIFGRGPGDLQDRNLSWLDYGAFNDLSRDGRTMLFTEQGEGGGTAYSVYVRGTDGSLPVRLGKGQALALSPDGRLALTSDVTTPMKTVILPTGPGSPRTLPRGPIERIQTGTFLANGRGVILCGQAQDGVPRLFRQDLDGGDPQPIASGVICTRPVTTPDDAFVTAVTASDQRARLYPVGGTGSPREIRGIEPRERPRLITDDGRWLFVDTLADGGRLFRIDLQQGTREPWRALSRDVGNPSARILSTQVSADGATYIYNFRDDTSTLFVVDGLR